MSTLPPVPPVPDLDRYATYSLAADASQINVNFPVYGDDEDITVTLNGATLENSSWSLQSHSGTPIAQLPLPLTDAYVLFAPVLPAGSVVEIIGAWQPRAVAMPTAPGIARREWNQTVGTIISGMREFKRQLGIAGPPVAVSANASGSLANRSAYDTAAAGFIYLQTDDGAQRPIFYVKNSAASADWSQALIVQVNSSTGFPVFARAAASSTPITLTGTVAPTVLAVMMTWASGAFVNPNRSMKVRVWGSWTGAPSLSVSVPDVGGIAVISAPTNAGAASDFDCDFVIDAVTSGAQVSNSQLRCGITPFYNSQRNHAGASNFASGAAMPVSLIGQLDDPAKTLVVDRWEVETT